MRPGNGWIAAAGVAMLLVAPAGAGTITGHVSSASGAAVSDAVVYVGAIPGKSFPAPAAHALMDQKNLTFIPHVLPVQEGTTVDFANSDSVEHNVFSPDPCAPAFDLGTWGKGGVRSHTFDKPCKAVVLCSIHPDMEAFVVVVPTPYFARTDGTGSYAIQGVPDGAYTLHAWAPNVPEQSLEVAVRGTATADFRMVP